ncbi:AraC family transcriptional regulator [Marinobacter sp. SS21]|uniref:AraC family transcriptional regulator n=1 Tax=Marinobacter sp. SS21 TaxID=2979460 RepID=UPI00232ABBEB|nr:AraC family transcriptional regulator [Marinobacter sp. SS21]MDC0661106.1 AraC family transcriptional regulator ligand-binding domain-containing protein [Marinobacter sp. SS21]
MFQFGFDEKVYDFRYLPQLVELARKEGVDIDVLMHGTEIPEAALSLESYRVSIRQLEALMENIVRNCRPGFTLDYGYRLNLSSFGIVGYAALSSPTVRDALRIACQYMPIVLPVLGAQIEDKPPLSLLRLDITYPISAIAGQALLEIALASFHTMATLLLDEVPQIRLEIKNKCEPYFEEFLSNKQIDVKPLCTHNRISIASDALNQRLALANSGTFSMSVKQCEALMDQLPMRDRSLSTSIQSRLLHYQGEHPITQEDIASELFMSVRSLHRFLEKEGTSFREIVNDTFLIRARHLLANTPLNISQVAHELGYKDAANFARAFRNQTGVAPSEYRKSIRVKACAD